MSVFQFIRNRVVGCRESGARQLFPHPLLLLVSFRIFQSYFLSTLPPSPLRTSSLCFPILSVKGGPLCFWADATQVQAYDSQSITIHHSSQDPEGEDCDSPLWLKRQTCLLSPTIEVELRDKVTQGSSLPQVPINLNNRISEAGSPRATIISSG